MKKNIKEYDLLLKSFPILELPQIVSKDRILDYSRHNPPLNGLVLETYFNNWDQEIDEYVEFIPCFRFKVDKHDCLVYHKSSLLKYEFYLVTINEKEELISRKIIAGMISNGKETIQSAATITPDHCIHIAGAYVHDGLFEGTESSQNYMEIMPDGKIVSIKDEE